MSCRVASRKRSGLSLVGTGQWDLGGRLETAPKACGDDGGFIYGPPSCRLMSFVLNGREGRRSRNFPSLGGLFFLSSLSSQGMRMQIPRFCSFGRLAGALQVAGAGLLEGWSGCKLSGSPRWVAQHEHEVEGAVSSQDWTGQEKADPENVCV